MGIALPNYDPADFIVPTSKLDDLRKLGFSNEELFRIVAPRRTLARRKEKGEVVPRDAAPAGETA